MTLSGIEPATFRFVAQHDIYGGEEKCGKPEGRGSLGKCRCRWQDNMKLDSLICMETKGL